MKYRKIVLTLFWPLFVATITGAVVSFILSDWGQIAAPDILKFITMVAGVLIALIALFLVVSLRDLFFELEALRKENRDLPQVIQRLQAEVTTKDLLLAREKEILIAKHRKLEEAFNGQKRINADLDKLRIDYENIIALNKTVWFMESPLGVLELIADEAIRMLEADRAAIVVTDDKGSVTIVGTSVATEEARAPLKKLFGQTVFTRKLSDALAAERFSRLDLPLVPHPVAEFLSCGHGADCFAFPIWFHKDLRGAVFIASRKDSGLIVKHLTLLEMFFSLVAIYLERNELITKEHEYGDIMLEQEKTASINYLTEGIAHNIASPLNSVMLSHELVETTLTALKQKYPDELLTDRLKKATDRIKQAAEAINGIVANLSLKASQSRGEKADYLGLNELLRSELLFMDADMAFKNDHEKVVELAENLPVIHGIYRDFSYIIDAHLYLAMHFLKEEEPRRMLFRTRPDEGGVLLEVGISGGVDGDTLDRILSGADKRHISRVNIPTLNKTLEENGIIRQIIEEKDFVIVTMHIPISM